MRSWWKSLGMLAGGLVSLGTLLSSASAQFPPPGMGMPPGGGMMGPPPGMGMPPGGGMMGPPPGMGMGMPPGMPMGNPGGGAPPGAFGGNPKFNGMPAEFPNPAQPSQEPASPFSIKDEGNPNAFSELNDPRRRIVAPYIFTFRPEYLSWYVPRGPISTALVTSSNSAADAVPGALGQPNTVILVPASNTAVDYGRLDGFRWTIGLGVGFAPPLELSGFSLRRNVSVFQAGTSNASLPFLARPVQFLDIPTGAGVGTENVEFVNVPTVANGNIAINSSMSFRNIDLNCFFNVCETDALKMDVFVGYRNTQLDESLDITSTLGGNVGSVRFNNTSFPVGFSTTAFDSFRTLSTFNGGQIGVRSILSYERLSIFTDIKLGLGNTHNQLTIDGNTTLTQAAPGRPQLTLPGGVLALPSNIGSANENVFSIIPETNVTVSYQLHTHFRFFAGYNMIYWSSVLRPGDHINSVVDSRQIPSDQNYNPNIRGIAPNFPAFVHRDFYAHGINIGIEFGF